MANKRLFVRLIKSRQANMDKTLVGVDNALAEINTALLNYPLEYKNKIGLFRYNVRRLTF